MDLSRDDYIALHAKIEALQSTLVFVLAAIGKQDGRAIAKLHQAVGEHWSRTLERAGLPSVDASLSERASRPRSTRRWTRCSRRHPRVWASVRRRRERAERRTSAGVTGRALVTDVVILGLPARLACASTPPGRRAGAGVHSTSATKNSCKIPQLPHLPCV